MRESGESRMAYFPGDIERSYWLSGHGDLLRLLHNTIRWITHDERIVDVDGDGFLEMFAWETTPGYAVHLLNYTNPNAHHGWMQSTFPLGPQAVMMKLPPDVRAKSVELLQAGQRVPFAQITKRAFILSPRSVVRFHICSAGSQIVEVTVV